MERAPAVTRAEKSSWSGAVSPRQVPNPLPCTLMTCDHITAKEESVSGFRESTCVLGTLLRANGAASSSCGLREGERSKFNDVINAWLITHAPSAQASSGTIIAITIQREPCLANG